MVNGIKEKLNIFKFGGSCFKTEAAFNQSLELVNHYNKDLLIIVCSAFNGITDKLIQFGNAVFEPIDHKNLWKEILCEIENIHLKYVKDLFNENSNLEQNLIDFVRSSVTALCDYIPQIESKGMKSEYSDYVVSFGERLSSYIFYTFLKMKGILTEFVSPDQNLIITNHDFCNALPLLEMCDNNIGSRLIPLLKEKKIIIIPGFYGITKEGKISTLGRGGSDLTAAILGYCLAPTYAVNVIFWKDVYGLLSANPKYVPEAQLLKQISYAEAKELTFFGTKLLHPKCLKMAEQREISVEIHNFNDPYSNDFTMITKDAIIPRKSNEIIKGITSVDQIALVTIESDALVSLPGSAAKIFSLMGHYGININFISQCSSENNITFGTTVENGKMAKQILEQSIHFGKNWFKVKLENNTSLLSVIGAGMIHKPGVAGLVFTSLGNAGIVIKAIAQGSSEMNITMVIDDQDLPRAVKTLYSTFIEGYIPSKIHKW